MVDYLSIIDKYYAEQPELRRILIAHSRQVADRALAIVDSHPEWTEQGLVDHARPVTTPIYLLVSHSSRE